MQIDLWTLALQAINFLILVWILHRFLYRPLLAIIGRRREQIDASLAEAGRREQAADDARQQYEARLAALHEERDRLIKEAEALVERQRQEVLQRAQVEAQALREGAQRQLGQEREAAATSLVEEGTDLALDLASRLLRQVSGSGVADVFFERVLQSLDELAPERIEELKSELGDGTALRLATDSALDQDAQASWQQRLADRLGPELRIEFTTDDSLIAGVELRFPHAVIGFSWRDSLNEARKELLEHGDAH
jgi:F-type H+-transporting ATPase subunit b